MGARMAYALQLSHFIPLVERFALGLLLIVLIRLHKVFFSIFGTVHQPCRLDSGKVAGAGKQKRLDAKNRGVGVHGIPRTLQNVVVCLKINAIKHKNSLWLTTLAMGIWALRS
jgi:hypothetical protein